jgi:hypothetical protein
LDKELTIGYERAPSKTVLGRVLITLYIYSKLEHVIQCEPFF